MSNAFMASAEKSKRKQKNIERAERGCTEDMNGLAVINIRVSKELHYKMRRHSVETGENMTQLVNRLLSEELG